MQKILCFLTCFFLINMPVQAYKVKKFTPLSPVQSRPEIQKIEPLVPFEEESFSNENYPKITELEYAIFNRAYNGENVYSRLSRLEKKVFQRNFSGMALSNRVDNLVSNIDEGLIYGIKNSDLVKLEKKVLGNAYPNDDTVSRITRLEKEMLGAMQSGNLLRRYETIKLASKHYNSYPEIMQKNAMYSPQNYGYYYPNGYKSGGINGFMQNILDKVFGGADLGAMTGYTPPIYDSYRQYNRYPYNNYHNYNNYQPMAGYGINPGYGNQDYCFTNRGGYVRNRNYGTGSSVRILN